METLAQPSLRGRPLPGSARGGGFWPTLTVASMIELSVPPQRGRDLIRLYKSWLKPSPLGEGSLGLIFHGFLDPDGWEHFTLIADETLCAYLLKMGFPLKNLQVRW